MLELSRSPQWGSTNVSTRRNRHLRPKVSLMDKESQKDVFFATRNLLIRVWHPLVLTVSWSPEGSGEAARLLDRQLSIDISNTNGTPTLTFSTRALFRPQAWTFQTRAPNHVVQLCFGAPVRLNQRGYETWLHESKVFEGRRLHDSQPALGVLESRQKVMFFMSSHEHHDFQCNKSVVITLISSH